MVGLGVVVGRGGEGGVEACASGGGGEELEGEDAEGFVGRRSWRVVWIGDVVCVLVVRVRVVVGGFHC